MMDSLSKCFNGIQERYENVLEAKPIYRDDLDLTLPLNGSEVSVEPTKKKSRCLQRAPRIDKSLRFEEEEKEELAPKPRKVVRFKLENNKIFEPPKKEEVSLDLDQELEVEPKEKPMEEKVVEGKEEIVRVKIKMTKQEAQRMLSKCQNDKVLDFEHVVDQIKHVPVHQVQVSVVVVASNNNQRQGNSCWLAQLK